MEAKDDYILWKAMLRGDRSALNKIYEEHFGSLYRYGIRMLRDEDAVKDCLHTLFLKIWTHHGTLKQTDNIRYYLISALRNTIINYRYQENRIHKVEMQDNEVFDLKFSVESAFIEKEQQTETNQQLVLAMNELTPRQKEIIYLRYFEELDYNEVAEIMGLTMKGAYKLNARALEALRQIMNVDRALLLTILFALKK